MTPRFLWIGIGALPAACEQNGDLVPSAVDALDRMRAQRYQVVVISPPVKDAGTAELLDELQNRRTGALVIVADPAVSVAGAVQYMRLGAHDVAGSGDDVAAAIDAALELRRGQIDAAKSPAEEPWRKMLIGSSAAMERTIEVIRLVGGRRSTVLITGETGTGKEVVAKAIHMASPRAQLPMIAVNCNALPETLLEAELFGHVKGAFTGAVQHRVGRFEQANRGTLFLDEVGDLPLDMQTKLLRVLQEREFQRVGSSETIRVDVRLIAATNVNLVERIRQGKFREDLYYRLNVVPISTAPLRERPDDIRILAEHFLEKICRLEDIPAPRFAQETIGRLQSYAWPGNVRQLENAVEMAIAMSGTGDVLHPHHFNLSNESSRLAAAGASAGALVQRSVALPEAGLDFDYTTGNIERQILEDALRKTNGNKAAAARILGLKRTTLAAKLKSLGATAG